MLWNRLLNHVKLAANKDIFCKFLKLAFKLTSVFMHKMCLCYMSLEHALIMF